MLKESLFWSRDTNGGDRFFKMADEAGFLTGETLDFIFDDFDIDELDEIFEEDFIQAVDEVTIYCFLNFFFLNEPHKHV